MVRGKASGQRVSDHKMNKKSPKSKKIESLFYKSSIYTVGIHSGRRLDDYSRLDKATKSSENFLSAYVLHIVA